MNLNDLAQQIKQWGHDLGFQQIAICDVDLSAYRERLQAWLDNDYQGDMHWMKAHGDKRVHPDKLLPGTCRVISARLDYLPANSNMIAILKADNKAYLSRYALGRDYHKLLRKRLAQLAKKINNESTHEYRAFVDSAPILERALAEKAGLGWIGKNTMLINQQAGSWFFLGEILTNLPLPIDTGQATEHCGTCQACLDCCPTQAFVSAHQLDARKCISYLTIEHKGAIPKPLRPLMGNRIFGCDDCQQVCPWNKFAKPTCEEDFKPRHQLDDSLLVELFLWNEATFLKNTEGSPIRRIGHERWLRNIAVALGNATTSEAILLALQSRREQATALVAEHIDWAIAQHQH